MTAASRGPTERFSDRVEAYVLYRPSYPPEVMTALREGLGVAPPAIAVDLGAGTGIFSALLLEEGFGVIAVEPNDAMRTAAERTLSPKMGLAPPRSAAPPMGTPDSPMGTPDSLRAPASQARFASVRGTAEATGLPDHIADFATAAQAFHWFDPVAARAELLRITRFPHPVALIWNSRSLDATPFLRAYDELLLRVSDDYEKVRHQSVGPGVLGAFYGEGLYARRAFPSAQTFDLDGFLGRALSSSYVPGAGHPRHEETVTGLRSIFAQHERDGAVEFLYETEVYTGHLVASPATHA